MYLNLKDNLCISRDFGDGNTFSYVLSIRNELLQVEDRITKSDCNKCLFIDIENGYAEKFLQTKNFTEDTFVDNLSYLRIVCEDGYSIAQETDLDNIIICKNEQWNKPNPVCVSKYCR